VGKGVFSRPLHCRESQLIVSMIERENYESSSSGKDDAEQEFVQAGIQNLIQQLMDPQIRKEFRSFMNLWKSPRFLFILNCYLSFFIIPFLSMAVALKPKNYFWAALELSVAGIMFLSGWVLLFIMTGDISSSSASRCCLHRDGVQTVFYLSTLSLFSLISFHRTLQGSCDTDNIMNYWNCNPEAANGNPPYDTSFILMLIPIIFSTGMRESRILLSLFGWLAVIATLLVCSLLLQSNFIYIACLYALISGGIIFDSFRQSFNLFLVNRKLKNTLELNKQLAEQNKATEMRHMIANVAHDLKTVKTFLRCVCFCFLFSLFLTLYFYYYYSRYLPS
jgi:hypothetical protein